MKLISVIVIMLVVFVATQSFIIDNPFLLQGNTRLLQELSGYPVYEGKPADLIPAKGFVKYELSTTLFTDYAEKERLVKIPAGTVIRVTNDGLPVFPDGTMLVKTFFYYNDKRDASKGKKIIETRILLKVNGTWKAGTYTWNKEQTDAVLNEKGQKESVSWLDETGTSKNINYRIPSAKQCGTCHNAGDAIMPIGFKIRNLNVEVKRNEAAINQLTWLANSSIINAINPSSFSVLPAWDNPSYTLQQRARAYLEVNCAHCHNKDGFCARSGFRPGYDNPFEETGIAEKKKKIIKQLRSGRMPLLGTTIVHKEGLDLIVAYIESLK